MQSLLDDPLNKKIIEVPFKKTGWNYATSRPQIPQSLIGSNPDPNSVYFAIDHTEPVILWFNYKGQIIKLVYPDGEYSLNDPETGHIIQITYHDGVTEKYDPETQSLIEVHFPSGQIHYFTGKFKHEKKKKVVCPPNKHGQQETKYYDSEGKFRQLIFLVV